MLGLESFCDKKSIHLAGRACTNGEEEDVKGSRSHKEVLMLGMGKVGGVAMCQSKGLGLWFEEPGR